MMAANRRTNVTIDVLIPDHRVVKLLKIKLYDKGYTYHNANPLYHLSIPLRKAMNMSAHSVLLIALFKRYLHTSTNVYHRHGWPSKWYEKFMREIPA